MKKSVKRILCGALSLTMCSAIAVEGVLRLHADDASSTPTATAEAPFKNVTGKYDTSALRESYFNDTVLKAEDTAPTYETRTVMVTLSEKPIAHRAGDISVGSYLNTWSGERAVASIDKEQTAFLQALSKKGISYEVEHTYNTVLNAVAVELDTKYVSDIKKMTGVESVVITTAYSEPKTVATSASDVVNNETDVYETGIYDSSAFTEQYGAGTVVAVLDTGLDYTHPAFQGFKSDNVNFAWNREHIKSELATKDLISEKRSGSLDAADVYMNDKVPFAYDYADDDPDVYPSYSNHGTHVAGIIGGYDKSGYTDKDGNPITDKEFLGVVPDAQLMICKVFTDDLDDPDLGGAVSDDIVAALEDCVKLEVDVINMSLGTSCGFTTTDDGDSEGEMLNAVYESVKKSGISLICAASNDYSAGYGGVYGTNLSSNPDAGTVGSPSTYAAALSVASINGQKASYLVANEGTDKQAHAFFEEARDINSNPFDFVKGLTEAYPDKNGQFEYVVIPGVGHAADYTATVRSLLKDDAGKSTGRIALVKRGDNTFEDKVNTAMEMGAAGVIVYNNVAGTIRMNLGEIENPVPSISISMNAGNAMASGAVNRVGKFNLNPSFAAGPFMSEFSSWGPTHDLRLKPEITAHGGEITSAVPGGYGEQSGTSMATPNMAGFMAIVRSYIKQEFGLTDWTEINRLAMQLTMSTAGTVYDQDGLPYSPRKQGAGVAKLGNVVGGTQAYLSTDNADNDYRPKIELFDDKEEKGVYTLEFKATNFGDKELTFKTNYEFMTETLSSDKLTVSEQAHMLTSSKAAWTVDGESVKTGDTVTVAAGKTAKIKVVLTLSDTDRTYIKDNFQNGMYVEGFAKLLSTTEGQCDLTIPFMGFFGDWNKAPMLDYSAYEVAANEQDASVLEEDKIKASVWATQPYNIYYNEKYVLPMGGYLYLLDEDDEPMYVDEEHNALSRYNEYYGEGNVQNYLTTTGIKAVYAGLLRNARQVYYRVIDEATGEIVRSDKINRVGKAYSGGGSAVPANVKLELTPEEEGWVANGRYRMEFDFYREGLESGETRQPDDTFEFSFTVDYEAPIMQDARIRFYNYKDGNKEKQRIYLDVDVYDNHYAQTVLLCYPKTGSDGDVSLQLATEYPTPVRNAVKNGVTTVSIEITDMYEKYGDQMYIQIDDYALNTCLYQVNLNEANGSVLPGADGFALATGEEDVTVDIYGTHKSKLVFGEDYKGNGDASNFLWTSANPKVAEVKNGEIVGISAGTTKIFVSNRKGATKTINVTVTDTVSTSLSKVPSISFGIIQTDKEALQKANGGISVSAGKTIQMTLEKDPWYHPMTDLQVKWSSSNEKVATVDQEGVVTTIKKGTAVISAIIMQKNASGEWVETLYTATSIMMVQNEFTVSNYTLTKYSGLGYTEDAKEGLTKEDGILKIPTDLNIMYIGAEAFKDNNNIKKIILPSSVVDINERAFYNCTALEEVYFVSTEKQKIADADVSMIYEQAFAGCVNLKKIDFSNTKTVTVAADCFSGCINLTEVVDMPSIGTMHHRAFAGTALKSVDLTGLHLSGQSVFEGCKQLATIETGKFTAIGDYMFRNCTSLRNKVVLHTPKIGAGAFSGCVNLTGVQFKSPENTAVEFDIGARAFENCGKNARGSFRVDFGTEIIRSIGERAFAGSTLQTVGQIYGLEILGENVFANTKVKEITLTNDMDIANMRITGIPFEGLTVKVAANSEKYVEQEGVIYNKDQTEILYVNASVTGTFTVAGGVKKIGDYAFAASKVEEVILSADVESLGVGAFKGGRLTKITLDGSQVTEIPASAFANSRLTAIQLPDTVTKIGEYAFANSAISAFEGNGVVEIGNNAFEACNALTAITLGNNVTTLGEYVFYDCIGLKSVTLPSVTKMGVYNFFGADSLTTVVFGANATTTGSYTFARTPVTSVTFGDKLTSIGEGAFYECTKLASVTLPANITAVEAAAFNGCTALATAENIDKVVSFGTRAFYDTALTELNLASAKEIGMGAFAAVEREQKLENSSSNEKVIKTGVYTLLKLPVVENIGSSAFFNGNEITEVTLPATLKTMGEGAFASCGKLTAIKTEGEGNFFAEDGVLYRHTDKAKGEYEIVSYPTARVAEDVDGKKVYTVKEGTVRVLAYAFYKLNKGSVEKVVLPYSVNIIGDGAFLDSYITEYTFESIEAPVLEAEYNSEVRQIINANNTIAEYKGYYNSNFHTYLYFYTKYVGQKSALIMNYPSNGTGYDNPIYTMYFGVRNASESDLMEDDTRECINLVEQMPTVEELEEWATWEVTEETMQKVEEFGLLLKQARSYYNNAMKDEGQATYITEEVESRLLAAEKAFREVKKNFGIQSTINQLLIAADSTHRTEYTEGEEFSMEGLSVIIEYDDYSTEQADSSKLVLVTTGPLTVYHSVVEVSYEGTYLDILITVTAGAVTPPDSSDSSDSSSDSSFDSSFDSSEDSSSDSIVLPGSSDSVNEDGESKLLPILLIVGGVVVLAVVVLLIVKGVKKSKKERAEKKANAIALQAFEEKYGEVHVNVVAVVPAEKDGVQANQENDAQVNAIVDQYKQQIGIPEGGRVKTNVTIIKK